ncbi:hypothetical protein WMY93_002953 [Mugilogobius chulae]|uniref:XK-related protein n=1 Tax=Mugilogobius chulae TaxID=88201 RepID=A0AAW0Q5Y2_9GOBI
MGTTISATRLRGQMRVTITGIFQGVIDLIVELLFDRITDYTVDYNMVSYVWLNFYYYIQIVPASCALFHWLLQREEDVTFNSFFREYFIHILDRSDEQVTG